MIGDTVGNYRILSKISVGGMGTVYKAEHTIIGKLAAVKVLLPELSTNRDIVGRFLKEAQATSTIKHPGIVDVIDFGYMASGHAFLVMEFLEGMSLARRLKLRGAMSEGEAAMLLRYICAALAAAHAKGIVHRDLKPDNIFLVPDPESAIGERPKLLDFGIAKLTDVGLAGSTTKTGAVMGTPTYMSPEQCRGTGDVDHRADLYSIGCIFYELVTRRPPFIELGAGELIGAHLYLEAEPPSMHERGLTPETVRLIMSLLKKRPEQRPQTAIELGQRLTVLAQQHGWITAGSPTGLTAPSLPELGVPPAEQITSLGELPSLPPSATTPYGMSPSPSPLFADGAPSLARLLAPTVPPTTPPIPDDEPTTLSGAASQADVPSRSAIGLPRRSRKGIAIAMVAAAALAGGTVAFVKLRGGGESSPAKPAVVEAAKPVAVEAPKPAAVETPKPAVVDPPVIEAAKEVPAVVETRPAQPAAVKRRPVRPRTDPKKTVKKSDPKPIELKKPALIETEID